MKKLISIIAFWIAMLPVIAQTTLHVDGYVRDSANGNPVPSHYVLIKFDSLNGGNAFPYYHGMYTDGIGYYGDTIQLPAGITQWPFIIETTDLCQYNTHAYYTGYDGTTIEFHHNFDLCVSQGSSLPAVITGQATNIAQTSAVLHGFVNPNGDQTYVTFEFGTTTAYGTYLSCGEFNGDSLFPVTGTLSNLSPGTLYHFRINGSNSYGTVHGADSIFVTQGSPGCHAVFFAYPDSTSQLTYHFVNQSTGTLVSWFWNFGDGNTSTLQFPPAHTYAQAGIYMVCLTVQGADSSCFDTQCDTLYVGGGTGCQAQYSYYPDSAVSNLAIHFIDLSTGNPTSWLWEFGDGTSSSTVQNPEHIFPNYGTYYVCLTITGNNCTSTWCKNVTVEYTPWCVSYFTFEKSGLSVNFQGHMLNGQPASYQWNFGDGQSGQGQNNIHQYAAPGIYYVNLTTFEDSTQCQYSSTGTVAVGDSAEYRQVYGQVFAGNFPITAGLAMIFSVDTNNNYNPFIDISYIDSMGIYYFSMVPTGNYVVYAMPLDSNGYLPTYYGDVLFWEDATVIALGQPNNPYNIYLIPAGNMNAGNGNINGLINNGGLKSTTLDKITMQLMDSEGKMISFDRVSALGDFVFPSLSFGTYLLHAEIAGIRSDVVQVTLSTESPTAIVHMTFTGNQIQGISEIQQAFEAGIIYPNPVSDYVHISLVTKESIPVIIELFTITGKVAYRTQRMTMTGELNLSIPVSSLPAGIYTLRIYSDKGTQITRKVLKMQ